jgi:transposase
MKTLHRKCAGLDVHKKEVVACLRLAIRGKATYEVRRFPTTTRDLLELVSWLEQAGCTHVAMEATGVYWKPVWHVLEGRFQQILANAAHVKGVPGRKSDMNDATWIADLLAHGLVRASFVPPQPIQELRDLSRARKQLTREIVQHTQRIHAVLEEANIKLSSVITDILGMSGRRILQAIVAGETDPLKLAELGGPRLAATKSQLTDALHGRLEAALEPFRDAIERLKEVPGLSETSAQILLSEIGTDMRQFPTAGHLLSWAGLIPRLNESAGKRRSTRVRKGAPWLKPVLVQSAWAASRKKNSYFEAQFLRLKARRGPKKAAVAVAASILTTAYHMLADGTCYQDLGADHFARRNPARTVAKLANRIRNLGFQVEIRPAA